MVGSEYNNLLRYLTKKEYNEKLTANEKKALRKRRCMEKKRHQSSIYEYFN
jgi:hypothetical protein